MTLDEAKMVAESLSGHWCGTTTWPHSPDADRLDDVKDDLQERFPDFKWALVEGRVALRVTVEDA